MVDVQMGAHHEVDLLGLDARLAQASRYWVFSMSKRGMPGRGLWLPLQASTRIVCLPVRSSQEWIEVISRPLSGW